MKLSSANLQVRSAQQLNSHGTYTKKSQFIILFGIKGMYNVYSI
jgi:hypothetical protein